MAFNRIIAKKRKLATIVVGTHKYLKSNEIETISDSHIIPVIIGDDKKTVLTAEQLRGLGYFVLPIRPPTVPKGESRLRLSLTADIDFENIKEIVNYLKNEL